MEDAYQGLEGVFNIIDDMILYSTTQEQHNEHLAAILKRTLAKGTKISAISWPPVSAILDT